MPDRSTKAPAVLLMLGRVFVMGLLEQHLFRPHKIDETAHQLKPTPNLDSVVSLLNPMK
jgi:hypothetical protein